MTNKKTKKDNKEQQTDNNKLQNKGTTKGLEILGNGHNRTNQENRRT